MKFTAQEEYGLRCLLQIAREPGGSLTIPEIAHREGLTTAHVGKLLSILRRGGVIKSTRGQKGGYRLSGAPEQINVGIVLDVLGGRLYSTDFCGRHSGTENTCVHNVDCSIRSLWVALDAAVQRALGKMTLQDLLCSEHEMETRVQHRVEASLAIADSRLPRYAQGSA